MSPTLLPLLVGLPLAAAGLTALGRRGARWPSVVLMATLSLNLAAALWLLTTTRSGDVLAHGVGGWPGGISIPFVGDTLSALMLLVTCLLTLVCSAFALNTGLGAVRLFAPLVLTLTAGVNGALLTADIFNLFVFIEVMLLPSYGLLILARRGEGTLGSVLGSRLYVTFNLFVSTVFLAGVAFVYGTAGTVNLAELAGAARSSPLVAAATAVCLFALGMKAAVVPTHGWLARAYPSTSPAVTALFSGLHTKVAIYAIYRVYAVVFEGDQRYLWIGVVVFSATMAIGVLGAVGEDTMRSILAFHMVSQIGYILLGVALFTPAGLAAGIFYLLHHMIVKASLFLSTGAIEVRTGEGRLDRLKGFARREPLLAAAFLMAALSLAGLPPFSGFVAKLTLILAALDAGQVVAAVVAIVVSLVTLLSMLKIWNAVFVSREEPDADPAGSGGSGGGVAVSLRERTDVPRVGVLGSLPALVLAGITLSLGLGAELLLSLASTAAAGLIDTAPYVQAVLG
ncbi:monovalent cation/H+ antiporter subunit D family protein [Streptomyces lonarensis]|uniref:Monovalent cation/H+ antiporter subunit D family protein n=1 Tax=Streptomyces lonarensis TaxID=700599 RepID=A0A7X6CY15_9ACTN|nr:monovalent cation/H+ antiporter subunit D family protein [Streptomyces lonarensis]NJQ04632.1 monovalent cation/H+ antiporter subunit D family protein [Streptomyces lonarensis]